MKSTKRNSIRLNAVQKQWLLSEGELSNVREDLRSYLVPIFGQHNETVVVNQETA